MTISVNSVLARVLVVILVYCHDRSKHFNLWTCAKCIVFDMLDDILNLRILCHTHNVLFFFKLCKLISRDENEIDNHLPD